ncbi:NACHT domain-containing protein [Bradyrhizobium sp.]
MSFVELDRCFVPIAKDQEPSLDIGRMWGRKIAGWMDWSDLREYRRIVLLAEASSGKTAEFRNQTEKLTADGKLAFFVRIEELADQGFLATLEPATVVLFERWRNGTGEASFFLDSVDEARLNRKSFEVALKRFAADLSGCLERAKILISCRVTDWKGNEDRSHIERLLPAPEPARIPEDDGTSNPLLDPIFKKEERPTTSDRNEPKRKQNDLLVIQLVPLVDAQCQVLAKALGVTDVSAFITAINQNGLSAFAERPGDLLDLADYWNDHKRFGTFAQMVEHSIDRKLREKDPFRPDNDTLPQQKAREGAERVAAALTLGKTFTLRAPGYDPDPSLASGAADPADILDDWTTAERNALLRRGVFAPSTYGRVRFHHRSTQEYLAARWFDRLLHLNCPRSEVWDRFFADRFEVETVIPSLRPVAAWLGLWQPQFLDEVIRREPLVPLQHGDPGSVPLEAKKRILAVYAARHAAADIADDSLDHRALWMFADQSIGDAARAAWAVNARPEFRMDLLRLIREGAITACSDLARSVALDETLRESHRSVAAQALAACNDAAGLSAIAKTLREAPEKFSAYLASAFAVSLFPRYLTVAQLLTLIEKSQPTHKDAVEGFPYSIVDLYGACPDNATRSELAAGLAELCLSQPFAENYKRISKRYLELTRGLEPIAVSEVQACGTDSSPDHLIRLLMIVERAERRASFDEEKVSLSALIKSRTKLCRALFWSDVAEVRANSRNEPKLIRLWQVYINGSTLWSLGSEDVSWLYDDLQTRSEDDQRIALSAIVVLLQTEGRLNTETSKLRERVQLWPVLAQDLDAYLTPPVDDEETRRHNRELKKHEQERSKRRAQDEQSWENFKQYVLANVEQLRSPAYVGSWKTGAFRLGGLTRWLHHRAQGDECSAILQWRLLEEGYSKEVAEAYRDGMKVLWRSIRPERPKRQKGGPTTFKQTMILSVGAIGLEAAEDIDWASHLSDEEAKRAVLHGCLSDQGYPEWIDDLVNSHPHIALPNIKLSIKGQWIASQLGRSDFLYRYARPDVTIQPAVQHILFEIISSRAEPTDPSRLERGIRIIKNLTLDQLQVRKLVALAKRCRAQHESLGQIEFALYYLALLFAVAPDLAFEELETWLASKNGAEGGERAIQTFSFLFDRHDPIVSGILKQASVSTLERLLRLVYHYVRPEHDVEHKGVFSPGARDNAESARNVILGAMIGLAGQDAYFALRRIAADPEYALRADRFRELARGMAERDTEPPAWTAKEVAAFEHQHTAPIKTGAELLKLAMSVLEDIQYALDHNDVSSRPLLQNARNEDEVRNWLMEQMNFRSKGRFNAYREAEVANRNMPDIIVSSTSAQCEIAIEVKHGGKSWTLRQYENALREQLANDYLKPANRRHGILVISNHGVRQWRDPETHEIVKFDALIQRLRNIAQGLTANDSGMSIVVRCVGIDAAAGQPAMLARTVRAS